MLLAGNTRDLLVLRLFATFRVQCKRRQTLAVDGTFSLTQISHLLQFMIKTPPIKSFKLEHLFDQDLCTSFSAFAVSDAMMKILEQQRIGKQKHKHQQAMNERHNEGQKRSEREKQHTVRYADNRASVSEGNTA